MKLSVSMHRFPAVTQVQKAATLSIMVGGDENAFKMILPLLQLMGKEIAHMGGPGAGQHTKVCNQILVAGTMIGVCESLLYASRLGLDEQSVINLIGRGQPVPG